MLTKCVNSVVLVLILGIRVIPLVASPQQEEKFFFQPQFAQTKIVPTNGLPEEEFQPVVSPQAENLENIEAQKWQITTLPPASEPEDGRRRQRQGNGRRRRKRPQFMQSTLEDRFIQTTLPTQLDSLDNTDDDSRNKERRTYKIQEQNQQPINYKNYRKPYSTVKSEIEDDNANNGPNFDLKSLLKQAGSGLSLSELLQQKNLSLSDILSKKQSALAALTQTEQQKSSTKPPPIDLNSGEMMMTGDDDEETKKHRRVPMFIQMPPLMVPTEEVKHKVSNPITIPTISSQITASGATRQDKYKPIKEVVPRIRPDFGNSNLKRSNYQNSSSTTIRPRWKPPVELRNRIRNEYNRFPANPKTEQSSSESKSSNVTESPQIITTSVPSNYLSSTATNILFENVKNYHNREHFNDHLSSKEKINNNIESENKEQELSHIEELFPHTLKNRNNFEANLIEKVIQNTQKALIESHQTKNGKVDVTESNPGLFMDITTGRIIDDKSELLELLKDRRNGAKLTKILEQRNMTLDELIEHRRRGSSQLHLMEILNSKYANDIRQGKSRKADDRLDIVTAFETFPHFSFANLRSVKPDEVKTDSQGSSYFASIISVKPTDDQPKQKQKTGFERLILSEMNSMSAPQSRISPSDINNILEVNESGPVPVKPTMVDAKQIPQGVRSAILASTSIVVVSVFIFVLIFIACRWRQKRLRKLHYVESFGGKRGRLPILDRETNSKRSISPIVYQTSLSSGPRLSKVNSVIDPCSSIEFPDYLFDSMKGY